MPESIPFFCCFLPVAFAIFFIAWVGIGQRYQIKHFWLYVLAGILSFCLLLVLLGVILQFFASRPSTVYWNLFHEKPTPDVRIANSSCDGYFDWVALHLNFYADQSTIDRLVKQRRLQSKDVPSVISQEYDPHWWQDSHVIGRQIFSRGMTDQDFSSEQEVLLYAPSTREAYYRYSKF